MDHLTDEQRDELRRDLKHQLARLLKSMDISAEAARTVELNQCAVGRLSRMDSLQSQSMAKNLAQREEGRLTLIQKALRRLDEGGYGICVECEGAIPFERLLVVPEARTCQGCA